MRRAIERPLGGREICACQIWPSPDKALRVELDTAIQPAGIRLGPGHQKNVPDIVTRHGACAVAPLHTFQMPVSLESHDLSSRSDLDRRTLFDATQQVTRHGLRKTGRSNEQMNAA